MCICRPVPDGSDLTIASTKLTKTENSLTMVNLPDLPSAEARSQATRGHHDRGISDYGIAPFDHNKNGHDHGSIPRPLLLKPMIL